MAVQSVDAKTLSRMFLAGAKNIEAKKEFINELNVFPVPDGDTGTNMTLTILSAVNEVNNLKQIDMHGLAKAISSGSLRGARGNSGVILSQLLRGFTKGLRNSDEINVSDFAAGFVRAQKTAYKAVMKPKEGTILTVARCMAEAAAEAAASTQDLDEFFQKVLKAGDEALAQTPELLPVLKEAGVVDSGGQGLMEVMHGAYDGFLGKAMDFTFEGVPVTGIRAGKSDSDEITFGYCTEFLIVPEKTCAAKEEAELKSYLSTIGDSIVCVADDDIIKIHVHTNDPGLALQKALTYGQLSKIKIDNMREEHEERLANSASKATAGRPKGNPLKETGFIAVSIGDGLNEIFSELGVDYIIAGGQTMNPSTDDMLKAIEEVNAEHIFILPNNKNIIMAAQQAAELSETKDIIVIPTKTIPQGITAVINYVPEKDIDTNKELMVQSISSVQTGQVTYAVRDTQIDGKEIHEGNIIGIADKGILAIGDSIPDIALKMAASMDDEEGELISIYYGEDISEKDASELEERFREQYPDYDIECHSGGQPVYYYIISIE